MELNDQWRTKEVLMLVRTLTLLFIDGSKTSHIPNAMTKY